MWNTKKIEKRWIANFKRTPLVDKETGAFQKEYAYQLFYGKKDTTYPVYYPQNFQEFYNHCCGNKVVDKDAAIGHLVRYLHFIGIRIRRQVINNHLRIFPNDFLKIIRKCYYIFKMLANSNELDVDNPFRENNSDIYFLLRIESEQSTEAGELSIVEDMELSDLYKQFFTLPSDYEDDPLVQQFFNEIEKSSKSFFITGKAGTGKSTFIRYFIQKTHKKVLLTAFSGIAAINVGGQTLHSFFRFPFKPMLPEDQEIPLFKPSMQKFRILEKVDTIIIDEVSTMRSDVLEAMDYSLRRNGGDPDKPFGGKQMLFMGDVFQLPPIVNLLNDTESYLFREVYKSEYFFDSLAYKKIAPVYLEFKSVHRQKDDEAFIDLLDKIRLCKAETATLDLLNDRCNPSYSPKPDDFVINLATNNAVSYEENKKMLAGLPFAKIVFNAEITGEFSADRHPTGKALTLKKNAQIICVKNDLAGRWVNGTIAKIHSVSNDLLEIRLPDGTVHKMEKAVWENRRYKYDKQTRKIVSEVIGTFTQYPIKLAWSITIHKSQGLTFDNIIIDPGKGAFINGQLYTALSRCRTLQGIILKRKLRMEDIIADPRIIHFHETEQLLNTVKEEEEKVSDVKIADAGL